MDRIPLMVGIQQNCLPKAAVLSIPNIIVHGKAHTGGRHHIDVVFQIFRFRIFCIVSVLLRDPELYFPILHIFIVQRENLVSLPNKQQPCVAGVPSHLPIGGDLRRSVEFNAGGVLISQSVFCLFQ